MVVSSPLDGTLALSGSKDVDWAITWDKDPTGSFVGGLQSSPHVGPSKARAESLRKHVE